MSHDPHYRPGDWLVKCDLSGWTVYASQAVKQWNGLIVYRPFAETRNPQDFVRGVRDDQTVRDPRPEPADTFLEVGDVTEADL